MSISGEAINTRSLLDKTVVQWIKNRARYLTNVDDLDWVIRDPVVGRLAATLFVLHERNAVQLSDQLRETARNIYRKNKALLVWREVQIKDILTAFDQAEIPVIPLKGAIIQDLLFDDPATRPMNDVDLLVHRSDFLRAVDLLVQAGMRLNTQGEDKILERLVEMPPTWQPNALSFIDDQGLVLDLHQNFLNPWFMPAFSLDMDKLWERSLPLASGNNEGWKQSLSPYDMLAHLCLHVALHGLQGLISYLDIDLWIRNLADDWDWRVFLGIVEQWQIRSAVYHVFLFCKSFMGTPVPDEIFERVYPGLFPQWRVKILITPESMLANRSSLGLRYPTLVKLALVDRSSNIAKTLYRLAFPGKEWFAHHPYRKSLWAHWLYVIRVTERGD